MGKQSRRKRQRGNKRSSSHTTTTPDESSSTLLQKLRHSDARTRHAALAALNATLLNPDQLSRQSKRVVSSQILEATRERVMDEDLECAQAAAGCLANYISFGSRQNKDELTAGWTLIFLERLKHCQEALVNPQQVQNRKQWLALTVQCQNALCVLIETNPEALERISGQALDLCRAMLGLLRFGQEQVESASDVSEEEREYIQDINIYSVRTLHSALDDNVELLSAWLASAELATEGWNVVHASCDMTTLPLTARLHAAGCLVTARQLLVLENDTASTWTNGFQHHVLGTVLPLLLSCVQVPPNFKSLIDGYVQAQALYQQEEADSAMERDVIQTVADRKEPARAIARRQKELKEKNKTEEDNDMEQDDGTPAERSDAREVLEQAKRACHACISPLQLALELVANVTSVTSPIEGDDGDMAMDEDDIQWTAEQEAQLMAGEAEMDKGPRQNPLDAALLEALAQSGLGDRLLVLLKGLCAQVVEDETLLPPDVKDDIEDLQSKCVACLGNCIGNLNSWQVSPEAWKELRHAAESLTGKGLEGVFDTMAVAIRTRPELRTQIQEDDLEFCLNQLSSSTSRDSIKADVICIVGLLCSSESHPQEVNTKVCSGLLSLLQTSSSSAILSEVFDALMDMYGSDEHAQVFQSLDVLGNFQRMLPRFKKRIQAEKRTVPEEEVEQWRETALNASRFISYKKGQL